MSRKAFLVQVELDVQAITCPGVWLCSNGKISLQIYMLDSGVQSASYKPTFPIQCNENFIFYKTFYSKHKLNELQQSLQDEWIYVELIQWQCCEVGNVLASFQTTLDELLYPSSYRGCIAGVDVDLLMEPTKSFPGAISPKIEVSTRTTIEETVCSCDKNTSSTVVVNPKTLMSTERRNTKSICRRVCHSVGYNKKKKSNEKFPPKPRPPFRYRKAEDDLMSRDTHRTFKSCTSCRQSRSLDRKPSYNVRRKSSSPVSRQTGSKPSAACMCSCGSGHTEFTCPVCAKYKIYFLTPPCSQKCRRRKLQNLSRLRPNMYSVPKQSGLSVKCQCCRRQSEAGFDRNEAAGRIKSKPISDGDSNVDSETCTTPKDPTTDTEAYNKPTLAEKLHDRLTKTLHVIPSMDDMCCCIDEDDDEVESRAGVGNRRDHRSGRCSCKSSVLEQPTRANKSKAEFYDELQKFYGKLYDKARSAKSNVKNMCCVTDC